MSQKPTKKACKYITGAIKIEKLIPGGQALATLTDGKKIFLWNALPAEIITKIRITKEKPSYAEGIAEEINQPSSKRVIPKDKCYLATSPWQILDYQYEMAEKITLVREIFRQHNIDIATFIRTQQDSNSGIDQTISSLHDATHPKSKNNTTNAAYGYRNKMEYALYYSHDDSKIHLAFHERGSHRKIPIENSSLERPEIFQEAQSIVAELNRRKEDARKYQSLLLRCSQDGKVSGGLFENHRPHPKFDPLEDKIFGIKYSYSPNGFFQINLPVYEQALESIRTACTQSSNSDNILDLYSGVGTIGLSVARQAHQLTLVECNKSAYNEMVENVKTATKIIQTADIKPILAKSEDALEYVAPDQTVIVDPPRAGCRPEVIARFLEVKPKTIIYLSCNPATQARDIKMLEPVYNIKHVEVFNFFPRTPHIENLVVLEQKEECIHGAK